MKSSKLFLKIFLYFFSLLIPVVILGSLTYLQVVQLIKNTESGKLYDNLSASTSTMDVYLGIIQSASNNLLLNNVIQNHLKPYSDMDAMDRTNLHQIIKTLNAHVHNFSYLIDGVIVFMDTNKVFTQDGVSDFDIYFTRISIFEEYDLSFWQELNDSESFIEVLPPTYVSNPFSQTTREVIPIRLSQYVNGQLTTLITTVSVTALKKSLTDNSIYNETQYRVINNEQQLMLQIGNLDEDIVRPVLNALDENTSGGSARQSELDGADYMVAFTNSQVLGWKLYAMTPIHVFDREPSNILMLIVYICLSLLSIGILFSFIFTKHIYNPIRSIRDILLSKEKEADVRAKQEQQGEFQIIGHRIHQLMQQHTEHTRKLDQYSTNLLDQYFMALIKGYDWQESDKYTDLLRNIGFGSGFYAACCFLFKYKERFHADLPEEDRLLIRDKMIKVLYGMMERQVRCYFLEYEQDFYVCLIHLENANDVERIHAAMASIRTVFEYDTIYCELMIGLGKVYPNIRDLGQSYIEAITVMDKHVDVTGIAILDAANETIEQTMYYSFRDESKIVNCFKSGDLDNIRALVHNLVRLNRERNVSYQHLSELLAGLYNTALRFLHEKDWDASNYISLEERLTLTSKDLFPDELEDRVELLLKFFENIINDTVDKSVRKSGTVVSLIIAYIESNYDKNLYLETIADEVGLSAKYISRMFKDMTGTGITDYISLVRISKEKELLIRTNLKMDEIADRIGIYSRTTFLRMFKKHEGVSPSDYRNAYLDKKRS